MTKNVDEHHPGTPDAVGRDVFRVVVILSGRGSNFEAIAKFLQRDGGPERAIEIVRVVSDRKSAGGVSLAEQRNIPVTVVARRPSEQSAEEFHAKLESVVAAEDPHLVVLAGFMRILAPSFVQRFAGRTINIHPSLLPAFPGLDPHGQAIRAGVSISGCTVHYVTEALDGGPIIAQSAVPVFPDDTPDTLAARVLAEEHRLYPAVVSGIARGEILMADDGSVTRRGARASEKQALSSPLSLRSS